MKFPHHIHQKERNHYGLHTVYQLPQNARRDSISGEKKEELSSISSGMGFQTEP